MLTVNHTTHGLIQSYLESLDCPRSLAVWIMFRENEHNQLLQLTSNPDHYDSADSFRNAYLATKFLSKATFLSTNIDKKKVAIDEFLRCEEVCREINLEGFRYSKKHLETFEWLHFAVRQTIGSVLSDFTASEFFDCANWGPGVTTLIKGNDTSSTNKFRLEGGITQTLYDFVSETFALAYPSWKPNWVIEKGNKIVTVPKNSKTDRTIAIEPGINLWFQKSIGNMIRRRLSRFGLDLNTQARNQHLCYLASKHGDLATVDFSSASDSISTSLIEELLPRQWFELLDCCRSKYGSIDGKVLRYSKFSSMGNGFTFELESLIFYAIGLAVLNYLKIDGKKTLTVYGDDVILPVNAFDLFVKISKIYGFTVNTQKSYSSGPFRESCGSHHFYGIDCKPYYLKEVVKRESEIYIAANSVRRISRLYYGCDSRFRKCYDELVKRVAPLKRCYIPEGYGDVGFISNFDESCPSYSRWGIEGYLTRALLTIPIGYFSDDLALLLARLKDCSIPEHMLLICALESRPSSSAFNTLFRHSRKSLGNETFLRSEVRYIRKKMFVQQWTDLGPWI